MPLRPAASAAVATDKPTVALYQAFDRKTTHGSGGLVSGRLYLSSIDPIPAGTTLTSITYGSSTTALSGGTHGWAALYDVNLNLLRQSVNDTGITWAANTLKTFTLASPVVTTYTGLYYIGLCVVATTPPNAGMVSPNLAVGLATPAVGGRSTPTGLTDTAPNPAATITTEATTFWGCVS